VARFRSYKFLLQTTSRQTIALEKALSLNRELYNAALEERKGAWRWEKRAVSYVDQSRELTELRSVRADTLAFGVTVCRGTLKRLDRAFQAFFRRCKAGQTPGFPRFKGRGQFDSLQWGDKNSWALNDHRHPQDHHGPTGGEAVVADRPLRQRAGPTAPCDWASRRDRSRGPPAGGNQ
jgi:putative transposase